MNTLEKEINQKDSGIKNSDFKIGDIIIRIDQKIEEINRKQNQFKDNPNPVNTTNRDSNNTNN